MNEIKMTVKEAIEQLTDLKRDREGFAKNDEPDGDEPIVIDDDLDMYVEDWKWQSVRIVIIAKYAKNMQ